MPLPPDQFVALLTRAQPQIYGFIGRMVIDRTDADDVLQETNMAPWKLADQFQEGTDFVAWACRVAYYRVLEHRTAAKRLRIRLNDAMLELLATTSLDETASTASSPRRSLKLGGPPWRRVSTNSRDATANCLPTITARGGRSATSARRSVATPTPWPRSFTAFARSCGRA